MNERIKELAKQAGIKITPMIIDGIEYGYEDVDMDGSEDLEKFAELIVRECGKSCTLQGDEDDIFSKFGIKHFGVEE